MEGKKPFLKDNDGDGALLHALNQNIQCQSPRLFCLFKLVTLFAYYFSCMRFPIYCSVLDMENNSRTYLQELFGSFPASDVGVDKILDADTGDEEYQIYEQDSDDSFSSDGDGDGDGDNENDDDGDS